MKNYKEVLAGKQQVDAGLQQIESGITQLESGLTQIESGLTLINVMLPILETSRDAAQAAWMPPGMWMKRQKNTCRAIWTI